MRPMSTRVAAGSLAGLWILVFAGSAIADSIESHDVDTVSCRRPIVDESNTPRNEGDGALVEGNAALRRGDPAAALRAYERAVVSAELANQIRASLFASANAARAAVEIVVALLEHLDRRPVLPLPVSLGPSAVAWRLSEVLEWMKSREPVNKIR